MSQGGRICVAGYALFISRRPPFVYKEPKDLLKSDENYY